MNDDAASAAARKMRDAGQSDEAIRNFLDARERLIGGSAAPIPSAFLQPASGVVRLDDLATDSSEALRQFATIKLNGGLATTMGLRSPKSLLEAREGRSFLDVIAGQVMVLRRAHGIELPLILMDSDATREASLNALAAHPGLAVDGLAQDFLQSMVPKLDAATLAPVSWPADPALEWNPPGHGDVYGALRRSGMLSALLDRGINYAMISNADNLGATLDPRIAAFVVREGVPFLMEVVEGTEAERKGGHIARRRSDGQLILRETAQTPPEDEESFRDYKRWRYYNTNSLWVDLRALAALLAERDGVVPLPVIVNRKTVDPRDKSSTPVIQLESAMGAAIESFPGSRLLEVPRTRFVPVKGTDDLCVLRSDVYRLTAEMQVEPLPERAASLPFVALDPAYYRLLDDFEARFPAGVPSLREAARFVVHGDVTFGAGVVARGDAELSVDGPTRIDDGAVIGG